MLSTYPLKRGFRTFGGWETVLWSFTVNNTLIRDPMILENQTASYIKWLRVQSENKVLLFDLPPRSAVSFEIPATRTDTQWIGIEGAFLDGKGIPFNSKSFDRHSSQRKHFTYQVSITDSGFTIQSQGSG
jgi:hypothetical protein